MNVDFPNFSGNLNFDLFMNWIDDIEDFFNMMNIPNDKKVKVVSYNIRGGAFTWWNHLQLIELITAKTRSKHGCVTRANGILK